MRDYTNRSPDEGLKALQRALPNCENDDQLKGWIQWAVKFVGKLPDKSKSGKLGAFRRGITPSPH